MKKRLLNREKKQHPTNVTGRFELHYEDLIKRNRYLVIALGGFLIAFIAAAVPIAVYKSLAATSTTSAEPESGSLSSAAVIKGTDTNASKGSYVQFKGTSGGGGGFDPTQTLPPGSTLPDDATCAARVVHQAEIRPQNATQNATAGHNKNLGGISYNARVDGNYTGSTDDILQWVACKWGIDVNIVRAQAAKESYWTMSAKGDLGPDPADCPPNHGLGVDGTPGQCPQSYGILQVRYQYHGPPAGLQTWPEVETSTAYNADYAYAQWRSCYEGDTTWLNTITGGNHYEGGDQWGCVGLWFSGRWLDDNANGYIQAVQDWDNSKIWTDPGFISFRG